MDSKVKTKNPLVDMIEKKMLEKGIVKPAIISNIHAFNTADPYGRPAVRGKISFALLRKRIIIATQIFRVRQRWNDEGI